MVVPNRIGVGKEYASGRIAHDKQSLQRYKDHHSTGHFPWAMKGKSYSLASNMFT